MATVYFDTLGQLKTFLEDSSQFDQSTWDTETAKSIELITFTAQHDGETKDLKVWYAGI